MSQFIGVDIGTSFVKGAVLDLDRRTLEHIRRVPFPDRLPDLPVLFHEVDPAQLVCDVRRLIAELAAHCTDCQGLVMCGQMHGLVLVDPAGNPLTKVITWKDQRSLLPHPSGQGTYYEVLRKRVTDAEVRQMGNGLQAWLPLCTLFWMAEENRLPEFATTEQPIVLTLTDYVLSQLCRDHQHRIEPTHAAAHGVLNLESCTWHSEVLQKLGLEQLQFPSLCGVNDQLGVAAIDGSNLACYASVGDHQCALLGTLLEDNELSLNISTGSQVSRVTSELCFGDYETRPYFDGRFLNTFVQLPAGRSLNVLVQLLSELATAENVSLCEPWTTIARAADAVGQSDLHVDLDFHPGASLGRGQIGNIREDNLSVGHLFAAAFQNMADNYLVHGQRFWRTEPGDRPWDRIVFSGGLALKIAALRTAILRRCGPEHRISAAAEDTLLGLLVLALYASGQTESVAQAARSI